MRRLIGLIFLLLLILPVNIYACMVVFYKQEPSIYEISQRSIAIYDRANQKVGLIPQISFRGRPQDFCAVVPTPTVPKLNTVSNDVFYEVESLTYSTWIDRGSGCLSSDVIVQDSKTTTGSGNSVSVIQEQSVGIFDTVTLSASDPDALTKWLKDNGYQYSVQDKEILDFYIQKSWVFTAMKIDTSSFSGISDYYRYNINPVIFRYSASSLIYPMRLASINTDDRTDLVVYTLSDSKMTFAGGKIEYANRIDDDELKEIDNSYPVIGGLIGQNRYLTKIKRTFSIMEMDSDIEIVPAPDNKEFKGIVYYGFSSMMDMLPLGIVVLVLLLFRYFRERRKAYGRDER